MAIAKMFKKYFTTKGSRLHLLLPVRVNGPIWRLGYISVFILTKKTRNLFEYTKVNPFSPILPLHNPHSPTSLVARVFFLLTCIRESTEDILTQPSGHTRHSALRECKGVDRSSKHLLLRSFQILQRIAAGNGDGILLLVPADTSNFDDTVIQENKIRSTNIVIILPAESSEFNAINFAIETRSPQIYSTPRVLIPLAGSREEIILLLQAVYKQF